MSASDEELVQVSEAMIRAGVGRLREEGFATPLRGAGQPDLHGDGVSAEARVCFRHQRLKVAACKPRQPLSVHFKAAARYRATLMMGRDLVDHAMLIDHWKRSQVIA